MTRNVRIEVTYKYPAQRVWRALTDSRELAAWLMENDFQPRLGHKFQLRAKPQWGWRGVVDCEVIELQEPEHLAYTWQGDPGTPATIVRWTLEPVAGGTRLRLEHSGFSGLGGMFLSFMLGRGWKRMLHKKIFAVLERQVMRDASDSIV